jgi:hypothetical protein
MADKITRWRVWVDGSPCFTFPAASPQEAADEWAWLTLRDGHPDAYVAACEPDGTVLRGTVIMRVVASSARHIKRVGGDVIHGTSYVTADARTAKT